MVKLAKSIKTVITLSSHSSKCDDKHFDSEQDGAVRNRTHVLENHGLVTDQEFLYDKEVLLTIKQLYDENHGAVGESVLFLCLKPVLD